MANLFTRPTVSVIIPTYNRIAYLQHAVESVIAQTFNDWELVVVDDGSTDDTVEKIEALKDCRIHVLRLQHTGNIASVRNAGVNASCGEWIAFLDSDDAWVINKLEIQLKLLRYKKKQWSYGRFELVNEALETINNKAGKFLPFSGWIAQQIITCEASVNIGSLMIERDLFNEVGGFDDNPKLILREDYELALRLALFAEAVAVPDLILKVREHTGRTTNTYDDGHERTAFVYEHFLSLRPRYELKNIARKRLAYHLAEISSKKMQQGKYIAATSQLVHAFAKGARLRHLLSAIRRGLYKRSKTGTNKIVAD